MAYEITLPRRAASLFETVAPKGGLLTAVAVVLLGSALMTLSAKVQVPFWPVPMTMQSMVAILIGMACGSRLAAVTILAYLAQGLAGLPVFAGAGAGPAYMAGPTGGYLVGFVLAAALTGWLAERGWDRTPLKALAALAIGHAMVFVPGVAWMAVLFGGEKAIALGLAPFWAATLLKTALGAAILQVAWKVVARRSQA